MKPNTSTSHPTLPRAATTSSHGNAMHGGIEIALTVLIFVLIGLSLDSWLGTDPWFVIGLFLFAAIASGLRLYYSYSYEMDRLEAERRATIERRSNSDMQNRKSAA